MIRYRCSSNRKLFRQKIGIEYLLLTISEFKGNLKFLEYRGNTNASLKLKRIDGKAPPGVDSAA